LRLATTIHRHATSAANKFTYELNLTKCLATDDRPKPGERTFDVGEVRGFALNALTPQIDVGDNTGVTAYYLRVG